MYRVFLPPKRDRLETLHVFRTLGSATGLLNNATRAAGTVYRSGAISLRRARTVSAVDTSEGIPNSQCVASFRLAAKADTDLN